MDILHPTLTDTALLPRYVTRFSCIGPRCEDSCCSSSWGIAIDELSFGEYKKCTNASLRDRFQNNIQRKDGPAKSAGYAKIVLDSQAGQCPFVEGGLCAIHRELGEDKLSDTCSTYPRQTRAFRGHLEQTLRLSCPEVARLALGAADAFDFVQAPITVRSARVFPTKERPGIPLELMDDIRIFCLKLMSHDGVEIWQRLAALGVFCDLATRAMKSGENTPLEPVFRDFVARVESGAIFDTFTGIEPDHQSQATAFVINFLNRVTKRDSAGQIQVWERISNGLGIDMEQRSVGVETLTRNYKRGLERLEEALAASPFVLKHYLLNEMYGHLFPFGAPTAYHHFLSIAARFGMLRLMLAAQCNTEGKLPDAADMIRTVQVFCRIMQHNKGFETQVNSVQEIFAWGNLENVFRFLPA